MQSPVLLVSQHSIFVISLHQHIEQWWLIFRTKYVFFLQEMHIYVGLVAIREAHAINILQQNPQSTVLKLSGFVTLNVMQAISMHLPNLVHLSLEGCYDFFGDFRPGVRNFLFPSIVRFNFSNTNYTVLPFICPLYIHSHACATRCSNATKNSSISYWQIASRMYNLVVVL